MRNKSKKTARSDSTMKPVRDEFKMEFYICMKCMQAMSTDCHEIARGSYRHNAKLHRCTWLALCRKCHDDLGDQREWPITRQLALKLLRDPGGFDLAAFNKIRDRDDDAITMSEIVKHLELGEF